MTLKFIGLNVCKLIYVILISYDIFKYAFVIHL